MCACFTNTYCMLYALLLCVLSKSVSIKEDAFKQAASESETEIKSEAETDTDRDKKTERQRD